MATLAELMKTCNLQFFECDVSFEKEIIDIFNGRICSEYKLNPVLLCYAGLYYMYEKEDYDLAKKYYLMSIEFGNTRSMNNLARLYEQLKDYDTAKKYYLMAIEKKDTDSMNNLAKLYERQKDYDLAKKYYLMAVESGNTRSMNNLGYHYHFVEKEYEWLLKNNFH